MSLNATARVLVLSLIASGAPRGALAQTKPATDLAATTIEDLMKILITTASRGPEGIADAPARVQVSAPRRSNAAGTAP